MEDPHWRPLDVPYAPGPEPHKVSFIVQSDQHMPPIQKANSRGLLQIEEEEEFSDVSHSWPTFGEFANKGKLKQTSYILYLRC